MCGMIIAIHASSEIEFRINEWKQSNPDGKMFKIKFCENDILTFCYLVNKEWKFHLKEENPFQSFSRKNYFQFGKPNSMW